MAWSYHKASYVAVGSYSRVPSTSFGKNICQDSIKHKSDTLSERWNIWKQLSDKVRQSSMARDILQIMAGREQEILLGKKGVAKPLKKTISL